ncbi:hypothetical protein VIGAN_01261500 [Vigna angularis var. angularis]|uniref:Uncharacterized protein n=1 Tax=Vigna angularis var. angularis TaxID=157739 RepID=A0A0S3R2P2_PHAAN|nr:hypothetical protein VIGAN_01261500 [Vigna angularis var. angularis]
MECFCLCFTHLSLYLPILFYFSICVSDKESLIAFFLIDLLNKQNPTSPTPSSSVSLICCISYSQSLHPLFSSLHGEAFLASCLLPFSPPPLCLSRSLTWASFS